MMNMGLMVIRIGDGGGAGCTGIGGHRGHGGNHIGGGGGNKWWSYVQSCD